MSDENQEVEQITKNPQPTKSKEKDPKKVAAGKKLAEYNRKAKEALAREIKRESEEPTDGGTNESRAWIPELSFTTVLSLVGIGFTAVDMYMRFYKKKEGELCKINNDFKEVEQSKRSTQPSKIPVATTPKIGML